MKRNHYVKRSWIKTTEAIKNIKKEPLKSSAFLLPVVATVTALIGFLTAFFTFLFSGGYSQQISLLQEHGFSNVELTFTAGKTHYLTSGIVSTLIFILLAVGGVAVFLLYMKTEKNLLKRLLGGVLFVIGALGLIPLKLVLNTPDDPILRFLFGDVAATVSNLTFYVIAGLSALCLVLFALLLYRSGRREYVLLGVVAFVVSRILLVALLWLMQNVIPLIITLLAVLALSVIAYVAIKFLIKSNKKELIIKADCAYITKEYELYVEYREEIGFVMCSGKEVTKELCTLEAYQNGSFVIYEAGTSDPIPEDRIKMV